jgi:hypothetical protein
MRIVEHTANAADIFDFEKRQALPGNLPTADGQFRPKPLSGDHDWTNGGGVYAIFFDGALLYIGKFRGTQTQVATGNILTSRWDKHLGSFTLRDHRLSFSEGSADWVITEGSEAGIFAKDSIDRDALTRDRGCNASLTRFRFGLRNAHLFQSIEPDTLSRFDFIYHRISDPEGPLQALREAIDQAEDTLIARLLPPLNANTPETHSATQQHGPAATSEAISDALESALANQPRKTAPTAEPTSNTAFEEQGQPMSDESGETCNLDWFYDRIRSSGHETLADLIHAWHDRLLAKGHEVHFKRRDPVDLRLRIHSTENTARPEQNVLVLHWQPRNEMLLIEALPDPDRVGAFGFPNTKLSQHGPLSTHFYLETQEAIAAFQNGKMDDLARLAEKAFLE